MNIKTWKERWRNPWLYRRDAMQAEIDELRAALDKRDAEIERVASHVEDGLRRERKLVMRGDAQRKVLEQALGALQSLFSFKVDDTRGERCSAAITAIQEILK